MESSLHTPSPPSGREPTSAPGVLSAPAAATAPPIDACAVVIPAYNEARVIREVVTGVRALFSKVIVVDDGSADATSTEARLGGATVLRHCMNTGQGGAIETGVRYAVSRGFDYYATMDADGQHQPSDALAMLGHLHRQRGELDLVLGSRFLEAGSNVGLRKRILLRGATWLSRRLHGLALTDTHNGLRVFNRAVAERIRFNHMDMAHASDVYDIIRKYKFRFAELPVTVRYTEYSRTKGQPMVNAINILIDFLFNRVR